MAVQITLEAQWEDMIISYQHLVNEIGFYLICCMLICFCGLVSDSWQNFVLESIMLTLVCYLIFFNLAVILFDLRLYVKLLIRKYYRWLTSRSKIKNQTLMGEKAAKSCEEPTSGALDDGNWFEPDFIDQQ